MKFVFLCLFCFCLSPVFADDGYHLLIDRSKRIATLIDSSGHTIKTTKVAIGRGGLKKKISMEDEVTPCGSFIVDIILTPDPEHCFVDSTILQRYAKKAEYLKYLESKKGLAGLFHNMNQLDFDGNKVPDRAYGKAYIGLDSEQKNSGPKMIYGQNGKPYWYSIALHGAPDNLKGSSGGCVHFDSTFLQELIDQNQIGIGSKVIIR
ncbi:MAG: L,D-transpeptidase family protein [Candidatus Obscuribacterales bacterium]|nr:L,D-transpeptidase family protein [Candidatus Obscuribacterales bacterium]